MGLFGGGKKKTEDVAAKYANTPINSDLDRDPMSAMTPVSRLAKGIPSPRDIIAPGSIEVDFNYIKIGDRYFRTLFVSGYPRFVGANWLEPIINFDFSAIITMFYYPVNARNVLDDLRRKIAEMEATINISIEKGKVIDPAVQAALSDAKSLQDQLVKGIEKYFQFSFYVTISAPTLEELNAISYQAESTLGSLQLIAKKCTLQMEEGFQTAIPVCLDKIQILRNMDTTSVATTFPFTSSELTMNAGILYGVNKHNGSLIIFDRFSLENANTVIFAKSGSGKSYFIKLEALRSLLFGVDIICLDPEKEYDRLCAAVGGTLIDFNVNSPAKINPFDIPVTNDQEDQLGLKILSLHSLFKIMVGEMTPSESAVLDRALVDVYKLKGITQDPRSQTKEPPLMEDLYKVLLAMDEPESKILADKMERYIKGSLAGIFDQRTNIDLNSSFTVFSIRNLEGILRPIAMFMILDFIWTKVKNQLKKRILIFEEAWTLMQFPDSALFVYGIVKRARKYYLGVSTITQDVADFLTSDHGKAVVTNSSLQVLMKQHPASIDKVGDVFYLSQGEKAFLLSAGVGDALFFAGTNHVAMHVKASPEEHELITTNPEELMRMQAKEAAKNRPNIANLQGSSESGFAKMQEKLAQTPPPKSVPIIPESAPQMKMQSEQVVNSQGVNTGTNQMPSQSTYSQNTQQNPIAQNYQNNTSQMQQSVMPQQVQQPQATPQYQQPVMNQSASNQAPGPVLQSSRTQVSVDTSKMAPHEILSSGSDTLDSHLQRLYSMPDNHAQIANPNTVNPSIMQQPNRPANVSDDMGAMSTDEPEQRSPYPFLQNQQAPAASASVYNSKPADNVIYPFLNQQKATPQVVPEATAPQAAPSAGVKASMADVQAMLSKLNQLNNMTNSNMNEKQVINLKK